jgi:hypothetical protein
MRRGEVANQAAMAKISKEQEACAAMHYQFIPFSLETFGLADNRCVQLVDCLNRESSQIHEANYPNTMGVLSSFGVVLWRRISVALQRQNALVTLRTYAYYQHNLRLPGGH